MNKNDIPDNMVGAFMVAKRSIEAKLAAKSSGIDDTEYATLDQATKRLGSEAATYRGRYRAAMPRGQPGDVYTSQMIHDHPESRGNGMIEKLSGRGIIKPKVREVRTGRFSKNEIDTPQIWKVPRPNLNVMSWNNWQVMPVDTLTKNIPIAAGVTTLLEVSSSVNCKGRDESAGLQFQIVIGNDNQIPGKDSDRLVNAGAIGEPISTGQSTQWHDPYFEHSRLMIGTEADELIGVPVTVYVRAFTGAGGAPIITPAKFVPGDTYVFNTDAVNVMSAPSLSASVNAIAAIGQTGAIVAGPVAGDGLKWYQINTPAGYVPEQVITRTTVPPAPTAVGHKIRSGWLKIRRVPV